MCPSQQKIKQSQNYEDSMAMVRVKVFPDHSRQAAVAQRAWLARQHINELVPLQRSIPVDGASEQIDVRCVE